MAILSLYLAWLPVLTPQQAGVVNAVASGQRPASRKLWHIAGSKRWCWLPEKMTKCLWQEASTLRQRQQNGAFNYIFVAYVTNNKRLYSTFRTVEANYWQTRSIARPLCDSRATCYSLERRRGRYAYPRSFHTKIIKVHMFSVGSVECRNLASYRDSHCGWCQLHFAETAAEHETDRLNCVME